MVGVHCEHVLVILIKDASGGGEGQGGERVGFVGLNVKICAFCDDVLLVKQHK